jgi:hypothetical protein
MIRGEILRIIFMPGWVVSHKSEQIACSIVVSTEMPDMRCDKHPPIRNKIDLSDPRQARILKRRLGISSELLTRVVDKVGNSISAVRKEVELQKASPTNQPKPVQTHEPVVSA